MGIGIKHFKFKVKDFIETYCKKYNNIHDDFYDYPKYFCNEIKQLSYIYNNPNVKFKYIKSLGYKIELSEWRKLCGRLGSISNHIKNNNGEQGALNYLDELYNKHYREYKMKQEREFKPEYLKWVDTEFFDIYDSYKYYLQTDHWKKQRQRILNRDIVCMHCGNDENLQVHHLSYKNIWLEDELNDLILLCSNCHKKQHNIL